jgi:deazaflavin-dependent oxidoreductase (nitroreductase family)
VVDYLDLVDRTWPLLTQVIGLHTRAYRVTRGVVGHRIPGLPPMLLLDHRGAKSGKQRTTPLLYILDGEDIVIVASKGGFAKSPAWLHNLRSHPATTAQIGRARRRVRAREATADERTRLWPKVVEAYRSYEDYQSRTERTIPLVILEPRS